jgi:hypothetical protein
MSKDAVQTRKVTRIIPFLLSDDDKNALANNAADLDSQVEEARKQYKLVKKDWNEKIRFMEQERSKLLAAHKNGEQEREVDCMETMNWTEKTVTYFDCVDQTKELLTRTMTEEELQMSFVDDDEPKPTKKRGKGSKNANVVEADFSAPQIGDDSREVQEVFREESSRHTKHSSIDPSPSAEA